MRVHFLGIDYLNQFLGYFNKVFTTMENQFNTDPLFVRLNNVLYWLINYCILIKST